MKLYKILLGLMIFLAIFATLIVAVVEFSKSIEIENEKPSKETEQEEIVLVDSSEEDLVSKESEIIESEESEIIESEESGAILEEGVKEETPVVPEDITIPYTLTDIEAIAKTLYGECRGIPSDMEKAAVAWCILNRLDAGYADTVLEVVSAPGQFIGYSVDNPVTDDLYTLAEDVLIRYHEELKGSIEVGRVLPRDYLWFYGDGYRNWFRNSYSGGYCWDWSLPNPYEDSSESTDTPGELIEDIGESSSTSGEDSSEKPIDLLYLGNFRAYAYCDCTTCCDEWSGGPTTSGTIPEQGRTIAVDPDIIPLGTKVYIDGYGYYVAEDTGSGIDSYTIDVYHDSHQDALNWGIKYVDIYIPAV